MRLPPIIAACILGLVPALAVAAETPPFPFEDGLWSGDIAGAECRASTTFDDGTTLTLARRGDATWHLRLDNPAWQLPAPHSFAMTALVDFYPLLDLTAEATAATRLDIAELDRIGLLWRIENGHTIDLRSDGFNDKYSLEGSAKIIQRLRACTP